MKKTMKITKYRNRFEALSGDLKVVDRHLFVVAIDYTWMDDGLGAREATSTYFVYHGSDNITNPLTDAAVYNSPEATKWRERNHRGKPQKYVPQRLHGIETGVPFLYANYAGTDFCIIRVAQKLLPFNGHGTEIYISFTYLDYYGALVERGKEYRLNMGRFDGSGDNSALEWNVEHHRLYHTKGLFMTKNPYRETLEALFNLSRFFDMDINMPEPPDPDILSPILVDEKMGGVLHNFRKSDFKNWNRVGVKHEPKLASLLGKRLGVLVDAFEFKGEPVHSKKGVGRRFIVLGHSEPPYFSKTSDDHPDRKAGATVYAGLVVLWNDKSINLYTNSYRGSNDTFYLADGVYNYPGLGLYKDGTSPYAIYLEIVVSIDRILDKFENNDEFEGDGSNDYFKMY